METTKFVRDEKKKLYSYQKVEVSPAEYIEQRQLWLKHNEEDVVAENKRHHNKIAKLEKVKLKLQNDIREAQDEDMKKASPIETKPCPVVEGSTMLGLGFR